MSREKSVKRTKKQIRRRRLLFLPYPLLLFLLLCSGAYLAFTTLRSYADDIHVSAKVQAPAVTSPASISSPVDGQHFSTIPIPVSGTCPSGAAYVEIWSNNVMKGSAICDGSGGFSLNIDLFPGANSLTAHVFNITDDEGPVSGSVTVYYDPPPPPAQNPGNTSGTPRSSTPSASTIPLQLYTEFVYKGYYAGDQVRWPVRISGGRAPYAITIDWGDGTVTHQSQAAAGDLDISHIYQRPGGYKNSFTIRISASDASGSSASLQFFVIIVSKNIRVTDANIFSKPTPSLSNPRWLWLAWPAYAIVLMMTLSFWLGEREELLVLKNNGRLKGR